MLNKHQKNQLDKMVGNIIVGLTDDKITEWTEQDSLDVTPHLAACPNYTNQPPVIPLRMIAYEDMTAKKVI